jgi:hypothetical protein
MSEDDVKSYIEMLGQVKRRADRLKAKRDKLQMLLDMESLLTRVWNN